MNLAATFNHAAELTQGLVCLPEAQVTQRQALLTLLDMPESMFASTEQTHSKGLKEAEKKGPRGGGGRKEGSRRERKWVSSSFYP